MVNMWDRDGIELWLSNNDGTQAEALPFISGSFNCELSAVGEATVTISRATAAKLTDRLAPWASTIVMGVNSTPLWVGTVVKRRGEVGSAPQELTLREWSTLLDKTWDTEGWPLSPPWTFDAATAIHNRFDVAWRNQPESAVPAVPLLTGESGLSVDIEFLDQSDETSPQYLSGDLQQLVDLGVDWRLSFSRRDDSVLHFLHELEVFQFDPTPVVTLTVGVDATNAELSVDTDPQATMVRVVAEGETYRDVEATQDGINIWKPFSYDRLSVNTDASVDYDAVLDSLGQALLDRISAPVASAESLKLVGLREDIRVGDMVRVRLPDPFDKQLEYDEVDMRVSSISFELSSSEVSTSLTLAQSADELVPDDIRTSSGTTAPIAHRGLAPLLVDLSKRVAALETRR